MLIHGGCLCGAIRFTLEAVPRAVHYCHCSMCRRATGGPFAVIVSFERNGRMQVCYDGELFRRVLSLANATTEERAQAALGLTRPDCIDSNIGPTQRASLDDERRAPLDTIEESDLSAMTRSRLRYRRSRGGLCRVRRSRPLHTAPSHCARGEGSRTVSTPLRGAPAR